MIANLMQKDILQVNNAGVNFNLGSDNSVEYAQKVITTNYFGTKNMIEAMIPMMKPSTAGARIVSVSSRLGRLNGRRNVSKSPYCALISLSLGTACWDGFLTWKCSLVFIYQKKIERVLKLKIYIVNVC